MQKMWYIIFHLVAFVKHTVVEVSGYKEKHFWNITYGEAKVKCEKLKVKDSSTLQVHFHFDFEKEKSFHSYSCKLFYKSEFLSYFSSFWVVNSHAGFQ